MDALITLNARLQAYQFRFPRAELPHESYEGLNAVCRYYVRASVGRTATTSHATKEAELLVQNPQAAVSATAVSLYLLGMYARAFRKGARTYHIIYITSPHSSSVCSSFPLPRPPFFQPEALTSASATADTSVKLEVGIEDCLHIEFEYDRTRLGLEDDVTGRVHFLLVRIRIKTMELALVRRETVGVAAGGGGGAGGPTGGTPESETLTRFEIMDGCPVRGEVIPVRMPLAGLDLTPTFGAQAAGHGAGFFSVRYFLNLVLLDEEDRRYFKQQELTLFRRDYETGASAAWGAAATSGSGAGAVAAAPAGAAAAPK